MAEISLPFVLLTSACFYELFSLIQDCAYLS
jgi:hypothetical protein